MKTNKLKLTLLFGLITALVLLNPSSALAAEQQGFMQKVGSFFGQIKQQVTQKYLQITPGDKNGKLVLQQAVKSSENLKTSNLEMSLGSTLLKEDKELGTFSLNVEGPFKIDGLVQERVEQEMNINGELGIEETSFNLNVDLKQDGQDMYVKLNQVPAVPLIDTNQLKNQWLYFKLNKGQEKSDQDQLTQEQQEQIMTAVADFIKRAEVGPAKKSELKGQKVFQIDIKLDKEEVKQLLLEVDQIVNADKPKTDRIDQEELNEMFETLTTPEITMAVNQNNFYFSHLGFETSFQRKDKLDQGQQLQALETQGSMFEALTTEQANIQLDLYLSDFNHSVNFVVPENYDDGQKKIEEALQLETMMQGMMGPQQSPDQFPSELFQPSPGTSGENIEFSPEEMEQYQQLQQQYQQ